VNVYAETNFVLELIFAQKHIESCENIVLLCEQKLAQLVIPAYCMVELHEKLRRQSGERVRLQSDLLRELRQLGWTVSYADRIKSISDIASLLVQSNDEEKARLEQYRQRLLAITTIIALTSAILVNGSQYEKQYSLSPQDAIVYASVMDHLRQEPQIMSCFLNKNTKDFDNPDIVDELEKIEGKMIPRFDQGYEYIRTRVIRT